jgi:hypothetical protein
MLSRLPPAPVSAARRAHDDPRRRPGGVFVVHYIRTGSFSPHKWAGFTATGLTLIGLIFLHVGIIGDMLNRHRIYLEELLYYSRRGPNGKDGPDE